MSSSEAHTGLGQQSSTAAVRSSRVHLPTLDVQCAHQDAITDNRCADKQQSQGSKRFLSRCNVHTCECSSGPPESGPCTMTPACSRAPVVAARKAPVERE